MTTLRITGGRVVDPSQNLDSVTDVWITGDRVAAIGPRTDLKAERTIDAAGLIVSPGWIDTDAVNTAADKSWQREVSLFGRSGTPDEIAAAVCLQRSSGEVTIAASGNSANRCATASACLTPR